VGSVYSYPGCLILLTSRTKLCNHVLQKTPFKLTFIIGHLWRRLLDTAWRYDSFQRLLSMQKWY